jgi:ABC-type transport system substrate-binding protein
MVPHEGVKFHGGQDFSAEDVKWTIDYVLNPETKSLNATFCASSRLKYWSRRRPLQLNRPWAAMPADLSTIQIYTKESTGDSIDTVPNGTDPYWTEGYRAITSR